METTSSSFARFYVDAESVYPPFGYSAVEANKICASLSGRGI